MNKGRQKNIFIALLAILIILLLVAIFFTVSSIIDVSKKTEEIKVVEENVEKDPKADKENVIPGKDEKDKEKDKDKEEKPEEKPKDPIDKNKNDEKNEENNEKENNNEEVDKKEEEKEPEEENTQVSSGSVFVNTDSLNVRQEASTDSAIVANVSQGSELYVLGSSNGWINVQVAPGLTGYVSKEYVTGGDVGSNSEEINQGSNASVTGDSVAVRMEANTNSDIVIYVNQGDSLEILDSQGDWYYVRLSNGFLGYIHKDYVG